MADDALNLDDLLAPVAGGFDVDGALETWRWLVPEPVRPIVVTAFGDLFLVAESGAVLFLDTIAGKCGEVAASLHDLKQKIQEPELLDEWFMPTLLNELREEGVVLLREECYSAIHSISLGGSFTVDNWRPTDWQVHLAFQGRLHEQIKDLPPGTQITKITFPQL